MRYLIFTKTYYNGYDDGYTPAQIGIFGGLFIGASWFFNPVIGINAELGYNINYAQIGMVFKLK